MNDRRSQRLNEISKALEAGGALRLKEAASMLGVSEMTVRRDVTSCGNRFGYLGGYIVTGQDSSNNTGYVFGREQESRTQNKREACELAAGFIEPRDTIFIDCGTTMPHLASRIPSDYSVTVVCFSLNIADIVCKKSNITLILLGGVYQPSSASFSSAEALDMLRKIGINKAFLSAGGVDPVNGASCSNFHEVPIKQEAIRKAVQKYVVVDSSKIGKVRPAFFATLEEFDAVISDRGLTAENRNLVTGTGVRVLTP